MFRYKTSKVRVAGYQQKVMRYCEEFIIDKKSQRQEFGPHFLQYRVETSIVHLSL